MSDELSMTRAAKMLGYFADALVKEELSSEYRYKLLTEVAPVIVSHVLFNER